ncbi:hypothetical protein NA78x_004437 [Anatilimnocola sp. NA78]|uniref:hypothetical protein n=1 Tax=Anatilimnocola sp. NA78 TaxID=3415683 RepID=UPI003CE51544
MSLSLVETYECARDVFKASAALNDVRSSGTTIESIPATEVLGPSLKFTITPAWNRKVIAKLYYRSDDAHFFTVEIFNSEVKDSFLLDEWMNLHCTPVNLSLFDLNSYQGTLQERLAAFFSFLAAQLSERSLQEVLNGQKWEHIPYDWGAMR